MKKAFLIVLTAVMLCGCSKNTTNMNSDADVTNNVSETVMSGTTNAEESAENIQLLWKTDITLQDPWVPVQELGSIPSKEISVAASEAEPIEVFLKSLKLESDQIDFHDGGVSAEYAETAMSEEAQEKFGKVWSELKNFNEFAEQNAILEIADAEIRHKAYRKKNPTSSFLYLNSWTGIDLKRTDSGLVSYFRTVYRYNREYEPDYYEIYGRTIDPVTGRVLALNDILTDTKELPQMIWDSLVRKGYRKDTDQDKEEFIGILDTAIQGCREDGSFGWTLDPLGIEFALIESRTNDGKTSHVRERAYIPFRQCSEILRPGIAEPAYDFMVQLTHEETGGVTGFEEIPFLDEKQSRYDYYLVQKDGTRYLYCSLDDHTDVLRIDGDNAEKAGEISAEINYNHYGHISGILSPNAFKLSKLAFLLKELFLEADAHTGEDGVPVIDGLYRMTTNPMPITTGKAFEAEIYSDENTTESSVQTIEEYSMLYIIRSDGESFVDCGTEDDRVVRLYIEGSDSDGWTVNGHPMDEVILYQGWYEE